MASASIGTAYLTVVPKLDDGSLEGMAGSVGSSAGEALGDGMASGLSFKNVAIGNVISDLANRAVSEFTTRFSDGIEQSDALAKFASTMEFAGFDTAQIEAVRTAMKDYADQTVYDLGEVMDTTAKLAANGVDGFDQLVQAAGNLNAAAGGNSESFGYFANAITQVNGAGKLMSQDWNQIVNALPGASGAIQNELREMGAWDESMGSFKDAMAAGEISSEEFNQALVNLGMTDVAKEAATSATTFEGAVGQLDASVTNTMQGIYDSLNEDDRITGAINGMASAFDAVSPYVTAFADAVGDLVEFLAPAAPVILGVVAGIAAASGITAIIGAVSGAVTFLTTVVGPALAMISSVPGLIAVITTVLGGPITIIAAIVGAIVAFLATNEEARAKLVEIWNAIKEGVANAVTGLGSALASTWIAIKTTVTNVVGGIVSAVTSRFNSLKSTVSSIFNAVKTAITQPIETARQKVADVVGRIKAIFSGLKLTLPHFALPHFSVSGGKAPWGIGGAGSPPSFKVDWYARGGFFDEPTVFLPGVGERGTELAWPSYEPYFSKYAQGIADAMPQGGIDYDRLGAAVARAIDGMAVNMDGRALVGQVMAGAGRTARMNAGR